jgi:hypothetical protein
MMTKLADLSQYERTSLVWELRFLTRSDILKTDEEARTDRERVAEILAIFGEWYPEDVFDRFDA